MVFGSLIWGGVGRKVGYPPAGEVFGKPKPFILDNESVCMARKDRIPDGPERARHAAVPEARVTGNGTDGEVGGELSPATQPVRTRWGARVRVCVLVVGVVGSAGVLRWMLHKRIKRKK